MRSRSRSRSRRRRRRRRSKSRAKRSGFLNLFGLLGNKTTDIIMPDRRGDVRLLHGKPQTFHLSRKAKTIFKRLQTLPFEVGGKIDFNVKHILERFTLRPGQQYSVDDNFSDFEVGYHLHPSFAGYRFNPPSPSDFSGMALGIIQNVIDGENPTQLEFVFSERFVYCIYFDYDCVERRTGDSSSSIQTRMKAFRDSISDAEPPAPSNAILVHKPSHDKYIRANEDFYCLRVFVYRWNARIPIRIRPIEPLLDNLSLGTRASGSAAPEKVVRRNAWRGGVVARRRRRSRRK